MIKKKQRMNKLDMMRLEKKRIMVRSQWQKRWQNALSSVILLGKNLGILSLISLILVGGFLFYRWNGGMRIQNIVWHNDGIISNSTLLQVSGLEYGIPLESISTVKIQENLAKIPGIIPSSIVVKSHFPGTIEITLKSYKVIATDPTGYFWILEDGTRTKSLNTRKKIPIFSCTPPSKDSHLITFLRELQTHDQNAFRDIARVNCDEQGMATLEFNSTPSTLTLNPSGNALLGYLRFKDALLKYPEELRQFQHFNLANEGFLFAS